MTAHTLQKEKQNRIGVRFRTLNIGLFVLVIAVMGYFMFLLINNVTTVAARDFVHLYSTRVIGILNSHLGREIALMTRITRSREIVDWFADEDDPDKRRIAYEEMLDTMEVLQSGNFYFAIGGTTNEYTIDRGASYDKFKPYGKVSPNRFEDNWYYECIASKHDYVLNVDIEKFGGRKRVWLNYKVQKDGKALGVLSTGLLFDQVLEELFGEYDHKTVRSFVIDERGVIQMDSALEGDQNLLIYENDIRIQDSFPFPGFRGQITDYLASATGIFKDSQQPIILPLANSNYQFASVAPIANTTWSVVSFFNSATLFSVERLWPLLVIIAGLFAGYTLVTNLLTRRMLLQPINRLVESLSDAGPARLKGDLPLPGLKRDDEFGMLARTIQAMLRQIDAYNAKLVDASEKARAASRSKSTFLASMSHEIRTPINAIVGMTHIGRKAPDLTRKDDCFEKIGVASSHLLGVINDILDISKIEEEKFELSMVWFDLEKMLRNVINVISFRMSEKGIDLSVSIDLDLPALIEADDQRLAQVVTNFLSNAAKFTPEGGKVRLEAKLLERSKDFYNIRIAVADTGIGIAPKDQERLFRSFEQAESATSRKYGGTGLGLAISKHIVEMSGGTIGVDSVPGKGAAFYFTFPARGRAQDEKEPSRLRDTIRLLVVDADANIQAFFQDLSRHFLVRCDVAALPEQALALVEQNPDYDLCFVEYNQPGGGALAADLKARLRPEAVIVLLAGPDQTEVSQEGAFRVLTKPLFPSDILNCIYESRGKTAIVQQDQDADATDCFRGRRMLLAEDVEVNREILYSILESTGVIIDSAVNGQEALDMFKAHPDVYDIILMDVQMPVMDGYQATRAIRALNTPESAAIPIIAMTANVFREDVEKCLESGMNGHIGKPIDYAILMQTLRGYLDA